LSNGLFFCLKMEAERSSETSASIQSQQRLSYICTTLLDY
jgi:hypothetical protein